MDMVKNPKMMLLELKEFSFLSCLDHILIIDNSCYLKLFYAPYKCKAERLEVDS